MNVVFKLALRNVFRHRLRTAMTLAAISIAVTGLILSGGFVADIFLQLGEALIHSQSGHLQIAKSGYFTEGSRKPERYLLKDADHVRKTVTALEGVTDVMARLNFSGLLNNGRTDLSIVAEGIEPEREARMGTYVRLTAGRQLTPADRYGLLIGAGAARALRVAPGARVTLVASTIEGAMNVLDFEVLGIFETFSSDYDARAVRITLSAAQELLSIDSVNVFVVTLAKTSETERIAGELAAKLGSRGIEIRQWQVLNDFYEKTVHLYDRQLGVLQAIVILMVVMSVTNAVNMTVYERIGEVGTMRAIGNHSSHVFRLLMTESALLGLTGAVAGTALGVSLSLVISKIGIPMPPPPNANMGYMAHIQLVDWTISSAFLIGLFSTIGGSLVPAFRACRIAVVDALRHGV